MSAWCFGPGQRGEVSLIRRLELDIGLLMGDEIVGSDGVERSERWWIKVEEIVQGICFDEVGELHVSTALFIVFIDTMYRTKILE